MNCACLPSSERRDLLAETRYQQKIHKLVSDTSNARFLPVKNIYVTLKADPFVVYKIEVPQALQLQGVTETWFTRHTTITAEFRHG
ncbi:hypothetical protein RRG08_018790 [Elysia crispata]|uniref:Uncharacterized protein n=1 Tax=Elysia crispata TaxID=231223 RepID=A0AAE1EBA2_9GAST|nr:hypothetical protein RRG08_018790 [Elysia crispata]